MRKLTTAQLAVLVGMTIASGVTHAQVNETLPTIQVPGYYFDDFTWAQYFGFNFVYPTPSAGTGPGQAYSANPNSHCNCTANTLSTAQQQQSKSSPSNPNNTSLAVPLAYANPIDVSNGSSFGTQNGGHNGTRGCGSGCMIFPNLSDGVNAAQASVEYYSGKGYSITQLINAWSNNSSTALSTTESVLGISPSMASATSLSSLTSSQIMQVIAAFAWQEGFKPSGC